MVQDNEEKTQEVPPLFFLFSLALRTLTMGQHLVTYILCNSLHHYDRSRDIALRYVPPKQLLPTPPKGSGLMARPLGSAYGKYGITTCIFSAFQELELRQSNFSWFPENIVVLQLNSGLACSWIPDASLSLGLPERFLQYIGDASV